PWANALYRPRRSPTSMSVALRAAPRSPTAEPRNALRRDSSIAVEADAFVMGVPEWLRRTGGRGGCDRRERRNGPSLAGQARRRAPCLVSRPPLDGKPQKRQDSCPLLLRTAIQRLARSPAQ